MGELNLPKRFFAVGEEPVGERVTAYHKPGQIKTILQALGDEEVEIIRRSTFGKFIAIAELPSFSGRFVRHVLTRQLKVSNKNEIWVLFGGKPVRFGLREFVIVTGLPCGPIPTNKKKRKQKLIEEPYWGKLFRTISSISVDEVINLLENKTVEDPIMRVKYACLALLSSILLPTSGVNKIVNWHAELCVDLDEFFAYPWGRVSFQMTIDSIKERDEVGLSQQTIAVKGFIHAFQLVMVDAVNALVQPIHVDAPVVDMSDEEEAAGVNRRCNASKKGRIKGNERSNGSSKMAIIPGHARDLDEKCEVVVDSIIPVPDDVVVNEAELVWEGEVVDPKVECMLQLINLNFEFHNEHFVGGATKEDVARMEREEKEKKERERELKGRKGKMKEIAYVDDESFARGDVNVEVLASVISEKMKASFGLLEDKVNFALEKVVELRESIRKVDEKLEVVGQFEGAVSAMDKKISELVENRIKEMEKNTINSILEFLEKCNTGNEANGFGSHPNGGNESNAGQQLQVGRSVVNGTGVENSDDSREEDQNGHPEEEGDKVVSPREQVSVASKKDDEEFREVNGGQVVEDNAGEDGSRVVGEGGGENLVRCSKRLKVVPNKYTTNFECDKRTKQLAGDQHVQVFGVDDRAAYGEKFNALLPKLNTSFSIKMLDGTVVTNKDILELAQRTKVLTGKMVDVLLIHTREAFEAPAPDRVVDPVALFDTKFVSILVKHLIRNIINRT